MEKKLCKNVYISRQFSNFCPMIRTLSRLVRREFHIRRGVVKQEIIVKLEKLFLFQRLRSNDYVSKRKLPVTIFMIKSRADNGESFTSN